jgi:hypothetical protein
MNETELSQHPTKGYRLSLSYYLTPEGKRSPKVWWLGQDRRGAEDQAFFIRHAYQELVVANGGMDWTAAAIEQTKLGIERLRGVQRDHLQTSIQRIEQAGLVVLQGPKVIPPAKSLAAPAAERSGQHTSCR